MTILLIGKSGQVATEIRRRQQVLAMEAPDIDLINPRGCAAKIRDIAPRMIINAAAFTAVDRAEDQEDIAQAINANAPCEMSQVAADLNIPFLHVSTDYVFEGNGEKPWSPNDAAHPLSAYGRTKLAGDMAVLNSGAQVAVLRTSWVFSAHGDNYVKTMLRLGVERDELSIVADQIGGPTSAASIAQALLTIGRSFLAGRGIGGIYHFSGEPETSWAGFSREIFKQAGLNVKVQDIPTSEYPTRAKRPLNSRLDCSDILRDYGIERPDWRQDLADVLRELDEQS